MAPLRRYQWTSAALFAAALAHALLTWPLRSAAALFAGGAALAFLAELLGVRAGLLAHELRPQLGGVPVVVVAVWPAIVYLCYRLALLAAPAGVRAAALAAGIGAVVDLFTDPNGVREGVWRYPEHPLSAPRLWGVPWWNFLAWFVLVFVTALLPAVAGGRV
ncbi:MAG: carotenoid biosynthesis protein [Halobacteriaceae archaeon]